MFVLLHVADAFVASSALRVGKKKKHIGVNYTREGIGCSRQPAGQFGGEE
jgi:hypothetical protein